jgi:hypothetical protein
MPRVILAGRWYCEPVCFSSAAIVVKRKCYPAQWLHIGAWAARVTSRTLGRCDCFAAMVVL